MQLSIMHALQPCAPRALEAKLALSLTHRSPTYHPPTLHPPAVCSRALEAKLAEAAAAEHICLDNHILNCSNVLSEVAYQVSLFSLTLIPGGD